MRNFLLWKIRQNEMAYPYVKGLYAMSFEQNNRVQIGEYNVLIPDKPKSDKDFKNYKLSDLKQFFKREEIPPDLKTCSPKTQEDFVKRMYHKRWHGEWWLIKGQPFYICGLNWYYLNFWWCKIGSFPDFRVCDVTHFLFWRFEIVADPNCYGALILKSRREGMTEKALCEIFEYVTRVKNTHAGMQNMTDEDVRKDYERIIRALNKMIWFFKPVNKGSDKPSDGLYFEPPSERMTKAKIQRDFNFDEDLPPDFDPLFSKITFETTKLEKYDGDMMQRYRQGEFGKIKPYVMDIIRRLGIVKPCLHLFNGQKVIGRMLWESTVEELGDGEMLERTNQLWQMCDPGKQTNGRSESGMKRLFRNALDTAEPDIYGFPKKEETRKFLEAEFARLEKEQNWSELSDLQRKNPITLDHALTPSVDKCLFNALKLKRRLNQLRNNLWWNGEVTDNKGNIVTDVRRKGNFMWESGQNSRVIFVDDHNGKWFVSHLLSREESNKFTFISGFRSPGNKHLFGFGVDPINTEAPDDADRSNPAAALYRRLDMVIDGALFEKIHLDSNGNTTMAGEMETGQFTATYCVRPEAAIDFYEDMLMGAVYFGVEVLYERGKGEGLRNHFKARGYWGYLAFRPESTMTEWTTDKEPGLPAYQGSIELYIQEIMNYTSRFIDNCKHPELIHDGEVGWLTLRNNPKSRTRHDLSVASGIALLAAGKKYIKPPEETDNQDWMQSYDVANAR